RRRVGIRGARRRARQLAGAGGGHRVVGAGLWDGGLALGGQPRDGGAQKQEDRKEDQRARSAVEKSTALHERGRHQVSMAAEGCRTAAPTSALAVLPAAPGASAHRG